MSRVAALSAEALSVILSDASLLSEAERAALIHALVATHAGVFSAAPGLALRCAARLSEWAREAQADGARTRLLLEGGACETFAIIARGAHAELAGGTSPTAVKALAAALHGAGTLAAAPTAAAKAAVEGAGLVEVCAGVLRDAAALHPHAVAAAARALGNAAYGGAGSRARARALGAGALAHAARALRAHMGDRAAARWLAHAAGNLAYEGAPNEAQREAAELGVAPLVVAALRAHGGGHAPTAGTLLDALANLLFRNDFAWERAVEGSGGGGLCALAVELLRRHGGGGGGGNALDEEGKGGNGFLSSCVFSIVTVAAFEAPAAGLVEEALALARAAPGWSALRPWVRAAAERLSKGHPTPGLCSGAA
jgi:hypothetical protein